MMTTLLAVSALLAQDPVKEKLDEFRKAFKEAESEKERQETLKGFGDLRDDRIVAEITPLLTRGSDPIRIAAAGILGEYRDDRHNAGAARALLDAMRRQRSSAVRLALVRAYGETDCEAVAHWLVPSLRSPELLLAQTSAAVAGRVRSKQLVMPLIQRLAEAQAPQEAALKEACRAALISTTGQDLPTAAAYATWWREHRESFEDPTD